MANDSSNQAKVAIPPLNLEEEDNIILTRITNDERPLRRVLKRFHGYVAAVCPPGPVTTSASSIEDAREAFLVELASYQLSLKKSAMVCEAETRQVEEYRRERQRIEQEHEVLRTQIEELKVALEHAQMLRRRKIEYDQVTERVNMLPPRDELEQEISALENDMAAIRAEHDTQDRTLHSQKAALDDIVTDLTNLRFIGKDKDATSIPTSPEDAPVDLPETGPEPTSESQSTPDNEKDNRSEATALDVSTSDKVPEEGAVEDDIEMGEVEEEPRDKTKKKPREEELEEGEASDQSSELSEPPDD
ncbi:hypothetical protein CC1G_00187 [Coprinopsis cinerea okayama7|uniref:Uncharacterized protein n=1 Tax=Coprinopsis cinerea (strain Okayama-7 / 130 / ATCC MYA-4618 / FGSC 9003) TaxID=240176 RepID=A8NX29_COPC7|nr:hypothetical protein CC1G_00187 [Coprinopsis cinerea okayama7\|eukprot:XP_001837051.2 hypothetical protein CC1G_00187 [Coprinopsis cinerea okayama7\